MSHQGWEQSKKWILKLRFFFLQHVYIHAISFNKLVECDDVVTRITSKLQVKYVHIYICWITILWVPKNNGGEEIETHLIEKQNNRVYVCGRFRPADVAIKMRKKMKRRVEILDIEEETAGGNGTHVVDQTAQPTTHVSPQPTARVSPQPTAHIFQ